jgi:c-di-GMP-binding flagellar brake protein YcgR
MEDGRSSRRLVPDQLILTPRTSAQPSIAGVVQAYDAGAAGLAVWLTAEVEPQAAERLDGEATWVTANIGGRLIAFTGYARRMTQSRLDVSGVAAPVEEYRREQFRAMTQIPVTLSVEEPGGDVASAPVTGQTIDLSSGGCRMNLLPEDSEQRLPPVGASADITLDLTPRAITATGEVLRVDPSAGEVAVQFRPLPAKDRETIERHVLSALV